MPLDPVHLEGIRGHARRIEQSVDEDEYDQLADTVWESFLDPLVDDRGKTVLEPLEAQGRFAIDVEAAGLQESPFPTAHGLDSGTINPTSYTNGVVLDVAHAAMAASPSDVDLRRRRTIVTTVYAESEAIPRSLEEQIDRGHVQNHFLRAPRVPRFEEGVVHELALYLAESTHALSQADRVEDLLVLDGPVYPKGLLNWADRPELADLLYDETQPRTIIQNYLSLVATFLERDCPLIGFVKNPSTKVLTRTLRERDSAPDPAWIDDTAFFRRLLEQVSHVDTVDAEGKSVTERVRETDELTYTNWFRSTGGADRLLAAEGDALGLERTLDPDVYEVTFFLLYDPRADLLYRIESPAGVTADPDTRAAIQRWVLREVATEQGPPQPVGKADELARISHETTRSLRQELGETLGADVLHEYDDTRWSPGP